MALKSVIDIELNDAAFQKFVGVYTKFRQNLQGVPAVWNQVNAKVDTTRKSFDKIVASMVAQNVQAKLLVKAQEEADRLTRTSADRWRDMARSTQSVAGNITRATTQLLRWTALTGVFSGLLGAGGLFGIDRLAAGVAGGQRSSRGLGLSYGEQKAFDVNYGRVVDTGGLLGGVSEALHDVTKRYSLYGAGLSERDIAGKDTGQVSALVVASLKRLVDQTPESQLGQLLTSRGLGQFGGLADLLRLKNTPATEVARIGAAYGRDTSTLDLPGATQTAWQDFTVQMSRAGEQIENIFVKGLVRIEPGLEKLSDSVVRTIDSLSSTDGLNRWLGDLGKGIETFANYIGTPEFQESVHSFAQSVADLAGSAADLASWLGGHDSSGKPTGILNEPPKARLKRSFDTLFGDPTEHTPGAVRAAVSPRSGGDSLNPMNWTGASVDDGTARGAPITFDRSPQVHVKIENAPGNNANVSTSQVAVPQ